jgi:hypothetical protein
MNFNRKMYSDGTDNDEEIARSLTEQDQLVLGFGIWNTFFNWRFYYIQLEEDAEVALISQIEEIILLENKRNKETTE